MQGKNRIFDDLAKVAGGAASTVAGLRGEVGTLVRQQLERLMADGGTVPRDEFDAVKAVAAKARSEQEKLEKRVAALEAELAIGASKPAAKAAKARKPAAKSGAKPEATAKTAAPGTKKSKK
jgi:BMFP domain-containing protein YqiC